MVFLIDSLDSVKRNQAEYVFYKLSSKKWTTFIAVNAKNAFNIATLRIIIRRLQEIGVSWYTIRLIKNYFQGWELLINWTKKMKTFMEVPQGSVIGPVLWNVMYSSVLEIEVPTGCWTVACADDLVIITTANTVDELNRKAKIILQLMVNWMKTNKLNVAPEKTVAIIPKGKRERSNVTFKMENSSCKIDEIARIIA